MRTADDIQEREDIADLGTFNRGKNKNLIAKAMKISSSYNMLEGGLRNTNVPMTSDPTTPVEDHRNSIQKTYDNDMKQKSPK